MFEFSRVFQGTERGIDAMLVASATIELFAAKNQSSLTRRGPVLYQPTVR